MTAVMLVLVFAILQSIWWVVMKLLMNLPEVNNHTFPNNLVRMSSGLGSSLLILWAVIRHNGVEFVDDLPPQFWGWVAVAIPLEGVIAYCFIKAMQKSTASIAVHVTLLAPIVVVLTSQLLGVDQVPGIMSLGGIGCIIAGLYVLHFSPAKYGRNLLGPLQEIWIQRGNWLLYAFGVALFSGFAIPITKKLIQMSDYAFAVGTLQVLGWGLVYFILALRAGDFQTARKFPTVRVVGSLIIIALLFGVANGFQAAAYNFHYAATVAALKRLDAPFTILWISMIPSLRLQEKSSGRNPYFLLAGSVIAFMGVLMIASDS